MNENENKIRKLNDSLVAVLVPASLPLNKPLKFLALLKMIRDASSILDDYSISSIGVMN